MTDEIGGRETETPGCAVDVDANGGFMCGAWGKKGCCCWPRAADAMAPTSCGAVVKLEEPATARE